MSEYLSKEEIKQWRSSLEKITLEEFARRLGKTLKEEKQTRDIVDIVLRNEKSANVVSEVREPAKQTVLKIAQKTQETQEKVLKKAEAKPKKEKITQTLKITFKKPLTDREKTVYNYFMKNKNKIVYAKDLASVLELPTDYVYKYIKNLRAKINENVLQNATKGGYCLTV